MCFACLQTLREREDGGTTFTTLGLTASPLSATSVSGGPVCRASTFSATTLGTCSKCVAALFMMEAPQPPTTYQAGFNTGKLFKESSLRAMRDFALLTGRIATDRRVACLSLLLRYVPQDRVTVTIAKRLKILLTRLNCIRYDIAALVIR